MTLREVTNTLHQQLSDARDYGDYWKAKAEALQADLDVRHSATVRHIAEIRAEAESKSELAAVRAELQATKSVLLKLQARARNLEQQNAALTDALRLVKGGRDE